MMQNFKFGGMAQKFEGMSENQKFEGMSKNLKACQKKKKVSEIRIFL